MSASVSSGTGTLWRLAVTDPSGYPHDYELRAPSEAMAVERFLYYKPAWSIREISRRPTEGRA